MKIKVTQDDIDCGIRGSMSGCPVALAIKRRTKWTGVTVGANIIRAKRGLHYKTPQNVQQFIRDFDFSSESAGIPAPFEFELA